MTLRSSKIEALPFHVPSPPINKENVGKKNNLTELFHNAVALQAFDIAEQIHLKDLELDEDPSPSRIWIPIDPRIAGRNAETLMHSVFTESERNLVYGQVYALSKNRIKGELDWGKVHVKDNIHTYVAACALVDKKRQLDKAKQDFRDSFSPHKVSDLLELPNLNNYFQLDRQQAVREIDQKLAQKSADDLNELYRIVYELSPQPKEGWEWGKIHAKDDMDIYLMAFMQLELQKRKARLNLVKQFIPAACIPLLPSVEFYPFKRAGLDSDVREVNRQLSSMSAQDRSAFRNLMNQFGGESQKSLYVKKFIQSSLEKAAMQFQEMKNLLSEFFNERVTRQLFNQCAPVVQFTNGDSETIKLEDLIKRRVCLGMLEHIKKLLIKKYPNVSCMYQACKKIEIALISSENPLPEAERAIRTLRAILEQNYSYHEAQLSFRMLMNTTGKIAMPTLTHQMTRRGNLRDLRKHYLHEFRDASLRGLHVVRSSENEILYRYKSFKHEEFPIHAQREVLCSYIEEIIDPITALPTATPKFYSPYHQDKGTLQVWAKNSDSALNIYKIDRDKLMQCSKLLIHHNALIALIKGRGDGHLGNTLFQFGTGGEISDILDCDDECSLPWENHNYENIRIWIVGHPRCDEPFDRATLMHFSNERMYDSIIKFSEAYKPEFHAGKKFSKLPPFDALKERLHTIQGEMKEALEKDQPLTARDLFFTLFGGKTIFEQKRAEGVDPILIFNYFVTRGSHLSLQLMPEVTQVMNKS